MKPILYCDMDQISFFHPLIKEVYGDYYIQFGAGMATGLYGLWGSGVHATIPLRAIDLGHISLQDGPGQEIWLNDRWIYDPNRPGLNVALWHNVGLGWHLHIQVNPNTVRRSEAVHT